jgi:hypothetical protein
LTIEEAGEIARVFCNVVDDDYFAGGGCSAAEALAKRDSGIGCEAAGEGPDDEVVRVGGVDQIEADPVVAGHFFVELVHDVLHQAFDVWRGRCVGLELLQELRLRRGHGAPIRAGNWMLVSSWARSPES